MANHLKYDIYDLDVSEFDNNPDYLERWLIHGLPSRTVKVSDILEELRLCAGDGQIIVFTTNHIDMLDLELLTLDLMNMHIHMPYCTTSAFNQIAFNHFNISYHMLFEEIEGLIKKVEVTLAEVSGELLKSNDAEVSLQGLIKFLHNKIVEYDKLKA
ncbi:hypothetical protein NC653_027835 [Populus alba x Populus x berolinensis]|uniref:AAA+ ATPase At3g28540-like C-terminal domain-containing protein n=2 Tax=Populus TaxID=3689 RepID=A0A4U5NSY8_POPAL|nr:hypothetical protein NC653_027835 [Populus alba x Populus x berolinensis]TKR86143.1 hypothetical protein D5086_0000240460 [Populus alba]